MTLYSYVQRVCVLSGCHGLLKEGAELEGVEHYGCEFLRGEALEEAIAKHGRPEIFNTDQGSQFHKRGILRGSPLKREGIRLWMGSGSWMDNVFIRDCGGV